MFYEKILILGENQKDKIMPSCMHLKSFFIITEFNYNKKSRLCRVVRASGFGQDYPSSNPDSIKDPLSTCGVHARKIHGSESSVVHRQQFTMSVVSGENFLPLSDTHQNCGGGDRFCCHLSSRGRNRIPAIEKLASLLRSSVLLCSKSWVGFGLISGTQ